MEIPILWKSMPKNQEAPWRKIQLDAKQGKKHEDTNAEDVILHCADKD